MSTPERPSLADTIARIDAALAEPERERCAVERVTRNPAGEVSGVRCQMQALPGTYRCRFHTDQFGPDPKPGYPTAQPGLRSVAEAGAELLGRERPPAQPPAVIPPMRPGWLARALNRLFGDHP